MVQNQWYNIDPVLIDRIILVTVIGTNPGNWSEFAITDLIDIGYIPALKTQSDSEASDSKSWICLGNFFTKEAGRDRLNNMKKGRKALIVKTYFSADNLNFWVLSGSVW